MMETVLSIAGSDPSGGAGIQADLKTMTAVGVYGAAAITCITVQNSEGVTRVEPLPPSLVGEQIESVLSDHHVTHVKIGMVGTGAIARIIGKTLRDFPGEVIYDPVLVATTGQDLAEPLAIDDIRSSLISRATVLTPNLPEMEKLSTITVEDEQDIRAGAEKLFFENSRLRCILVTGGHAPGKSVLTDYLLYRSADNIGIESLSHPFIMSRNTHGTGCTLSTAFTSYLALRHDDKTAFRNGVSFLLNLLEQSRSAELVRNPKGKGGLLHHLAGR